MWTLGRIFEARSRDIKSGELYRWSKKTYRHVCFRKISPDLDYLFINRIHVGNILWNHITETVKIAFFTDFDVSGIRMRSHTWNDDVMFILRNLYLFAEADSRSSLKEKYENSKKSKIPSIIMQESRLTKSLNLHKQSNMFSGSYTDPVTISSSTTMEADLGVSISYPHITKYIRREFGLSAIPEIISITPNSDTSELYDRILSDISMLPTIDLSHIANNILLVGPEERHIPNFKLANYIKFIRKFREFIPDSIDQTKLIQKKNFMNTSYVHSILLGDNGVEVIIYTNLFDLFYTSPELYTTPMTLDELQDYVKGNTSSNIFVKIYNTFLKFF